LPFEQAREFVRALGLKSEAEWTEYCKSDKKPGNIPSAPRVVYGDEGWTSWGDWLGTGRIADQKTGWSITKVKELLRALIQSGTIYQWSEAVLYSFLIRKGLLNLAGSRHYQFFKNLIPASRTEEGQKAHKSIMQIPIQRLLQIYQSSSHTKFKTQEKRSKKQLLKSSLN